jgi:hypothetical protein
VAPIVKRFLTNMPQRFENASGEVRLQGAILDTDESTGRARLIWRFSETAGAGGFPLIGRTPIPSTCLPVTLW